MIKKLVGNVMSMFMEVIMWITFVVFALIGLIAGWKQFDLIGAICGLGLGAIIGIVMNTGWWLISMFQEIRDYLKEIAEKSH